MWSTCQQKEQAAAADVVNLPAKRTSSSSTCGQTASKKNKQQQHMWSTCQQKEQAAAAHVVNLPANRTSSSSTCGQTASKQTAAIDCCAVLSALGLYLWKASLSRQGQQPPYHCCRLRS
jgi:hypothetical protein